MTAARDLGRNLLLSIVSILVLLVGLEVASRIWATLRWDPGARDALIARVTSKAGYVYAAETGYRLQPDVHRRDPEGREFTHNHLGFRSRQEFASPKPDGVVRIVLMGASTVYGIYVGDAETSSARLGEWLARRHVKTQFEVINAGVPGWTTRETIISIDQILKLGPDIVVVADGRNDIFPELFDNYVDDYGHYRPIGYDFREGNRLHKSIFRVSYFAILMTTARGNRFGYAPVNEHPVYGYIRWENKPNPKGVVRNGQDIGRTEGFRRHLETLVARTTAHKAGLVLASLPFLAERFRSGVLLPDPEVRPVLERFARANNRITESVAHERGLPFVDGASLTATDLLVDDCHFRPVGEEAFANLIGAAIEPLVRRLTTERASLSAFAEGRRP